MELSRLRGLLYGPIVGLKDHGTHEALPSICEKLGLPTPDHGGSKRERMEASYAALPDAELPRVAECFLRLFHPPAALKNDLQELLSADTPGPEIPKRFRREIAQTLTPEDLYLNGRCFDELLDRLWIIDDDPFAAFLLGDGNRGLRAQIQRHSFGFQWQAVELESPLAQLFTKKGDPSAKLTHAIRQITDWRAWIKRNQD